MLLESKKAKQLDYPKKYIFVSGREIRRDRNFGKKGKTLVKCGEIYLKS